MLTALGGWVLKDTKDFVTAANIIQYVNNKGSDPITDETIADKLRNWAKGWH